MSVEVFEASVHWEGSTAVGYEAYSRSHTGRAASEEVGLTTGNRYGVPTLMNPEQLVVMAAASCQLLWFLHLAAKARIDVCQYTDHAAADMPEEPTPVALSEIRLRPRIVVAAGTSEERVRKLVELAHHECYVANSLRCPVLVEPEIEVRPAP